MVGALREKLNWHHPQVLPKGHWLAPWIVFAAICIANILAVMSLWAVDLGGSSIAGALLLGDTQLNWVSLSYIVISSTCVPISDWFSNRWGYKMIFFIGVVLFFTGTFFSGLATSFWPMIISRLVAGLGSAGIFPNSITLLVKVFNPKLKALVVSLYVTMAFGVGTVVGLLLGGYLLEFVSWQSIFFIAIWFVPFVLGSIFCFFSETEKKDMGKFDTWGVLMYLIFVVSLVAWIADVKAQWNTDGFHSTFAVSTLTIAILSFIAFIVYENICKKPLMNLSLFRVSTFLNGGLALLLVAFSFFSTVSAYNDMFQNALGYSQYQAGYYIMPVGIGLGVMGGLSSYLSEKIGETVVSLIGMALVIYSCIQQQAITIQSGHFQMNMILLVRGAGLGLALGPLTALMLQDIRPALMGQAAFMATLFRQMGGSLGSLVLSLIREIRQPFHEARYAEQASFSPQNLMQTGEKLKSFFVTESGATPSETISLTASGGATNSGFMSYRWLTESIKSQATITAANDAFLIFGIGVALIMTVIIFLVLKKKIKSALKKK